MTSADHAPDRLGPYRLLDRIGEGGMGVVYLARDPEQRSVAVKILRPAVAGDPNARRRLAREVETMRRVRSPFVAEVIDTDVTGAVPYIVTQYVPGRTLDEVVTQEGPLSGGGLIRLASGLAEALTAIHAAGVVHRDLKPGNVMLVNGNPVVIDFGIAQALDSTRLTMTGMFMGTPGYLSPEVIEGHNSTSFSDVHAWGATVAFAATGRPPFGTGSYETIFYRIINGQPDLTGVAPPLADLLAAALRRDPASRPAASQLISRSAALDPRALPAVPVPGDSPWAAAMNGAGTGADPRGAQAGAPGTRADQPPYYPTADAFAVGGRAGPGSTMGAGQAAAYPPSAVARVAPRPGTQPMAAGKIRAEDFADVLPPVSYPPAVPAGKDYPGGMAGPGQDGLAGRAGAPAARSRPGAADRAADGAWTASRRQPLLVLATIVIVVSLAVVLPVAGTVLALAALALLRAGDLAHSAADQRSPFVTAAAFPFYVIRALLTTVLLAPLAIVAAALAGGAAFVVAPTGTLARALSVAAGGLVVFYAYGPGSGKPRRQLSRMFSAMIRNSGVQAVALLAIGALAFAAIAAAITSAAAFWPLAAPTGSLLHLPSLPGVFGQLHGQLSRLHL
jgi:predicted Ser/Thr protein kinase